MKIKDGKLKDEMALSK